MKNLLLISILSLGLVFNTGCYKDRDDTQESISTTEQPDIIIDTNLHGNFTDASNQTSDNYTLVINEQLYEVNQNIYSIELQNVNKKNQHISIMQGGIEVAFANVSLIENDNNKINIKAFPEWETIRVSSVENTIELANNTRIKITSGIEADISFGQIESDDLINQMGRWGADNEGNQYFLHTSSAFYINSDDLVENSIELINTNSSEEFSVFYFNESFHQWTLVDSFSSATNSLALPTLGYYILAITSAAIFSEGQLTIEELPFSYQGLELSILENSSLELISSANGRWSSFLPADFMATLRIADPCENLVHEEEFLIGENNLTIETSIQNSNNIIPLSFKSLNCEGEANSKQGAVVDFGTMETVMIFSDEKPEVAVISCGNIIISGYDVNEDQEGIKLPWSNDIEDELDYLSTCQNFSEGFSFIKINGEMEVLPPFTLLQEGDKSTFQSAENDIRLIIKGEGIGRYENNEVNFFIDDKEFGENGYRMFCENSTAGCGFDDCYISHYEEMSNGLTRITFSGVLWMQTIENPTAGNYQIEGQIITTL